VRPHWHNSSNKEKAPLHQDNHSSPLVLYSALIKLPVSAIAFNDYLSVGFAPPLDRENFHGAMEVLQIRRRLLARSLTK
jgi:hypothetical protein